METSWDKLPVKLLPPIQKALADLGFKTMTPVQAACIPLLLSYKDVAAEAVTGSGKTLAFLIPAIQILLKLDITLKTHDIGVLIVSPTRELATQIFEVLQCFLRYCPQFSSLLLVGGRNISGDVDAYEKNGGNFIVATPGRLEDLLSRQTSSGPALAAGVKMLEVLILDEADRLLDLGFTNTLNKIMAYLPKQRRTGLFSATQTSDVVSLIRAGLRNPVQVKVREEGAVGDERTPVSLQKYYLVCEADKKFATLLLLLKERAKLKNMVFFPTCACVEYFTVVLKDMLKNIPVLSIHGKMKDKRFPMFDKFRVMSSGVLICTDVMCRGVDIPKVDWVIQYDPPSSASAFVHRCGRTARIGFEGSALVLLMPDELDYVTFIRLNQKVTLKELDPPRNLPHVLKRMRQLQIEDRAVMDAANRAFVSYIQAYAKHESNLIISVKKLHLGLLATGFGLLKMPRMPELKEKVVRDFTPVDLDLNSIKYRHTAKEQSRQRKLKAYEETGKWPGFKEHKPRQKAWSKTKEKRRLKADRKKELAKRKASTSKERDQDLDEFDSLGEDIRMLKKLKKRKITLQDMDKHFGCEKDELGDGNDE